MNTISIIFITQYTIFGWSLMICSLLEQFQSKSKYIPSPPLTRYIWFPWALGSGRTHSTDRINISRQMSDEIDTHLMQVVHIHNFIIWLIMLENKMMTECNLYARYPNLIWDFIFILLLLPKPWYKHYLHMKDYADECMILNRRRSIQFMCWK